VYRGSNGTMAAQPRPGTAAQQQRLSKPAARQLQHSKRSADARRSN
jgi:hypothetical protein